MAQKLTAFDLEGWIADHREELVPPVNAKTIFEDSDTYVIMAVGGPNDRPDFHQNETEEYFRQIKGDMVLKIKDEDGIRDVPIREGEILLLPANTKHSPRRPADTIGIIVERVREPQHVDRLFWYCQNCENELHQIEVRGVGNRLGQAIAPFIEEYYASEVIRTCDECGMVNPGKS